MNEIFGYQFKNTDLLKRALTHCSFSKENYERLEYLGDSILDFVVGEFLFVHSEESEGSLTKFRSRLVSEANLCKIFDKLNIENEVILGKSYQGELSISIKADMVESIIGAVYLDSNFYKVKKFIVKLLNLNEFKKLQDEDYKSRLQEVLQEKGKKVSYRLIAKTGENHNPTFEMGLYIDKKHFLSAVSTSKQRAENLAAKKALEQLKK